jgi:hypothetical protein
MPAMIIVNNSSSATPWTVVFSEGQLKGTVEAHQFHNIDNLPGTPPYTVGFTCAGVEGVKSKDAVITYDMSAPTRVQASYKG